MMALQRNEFVTGGDMRTPVAFYKATPTDDFFPGETVEEVVFKCFANVYQPSQKDLDMTNNQVSLTMVTYHPINIEITDDMYFEIQLPQYKNKNTIFNKSLMIQITIGTLRLLGRFQNERRR